MQLHVKENIHVKHAKVELACQLWKDENFELPPEQREAPSREGWLDEFRCDALNEFSIFAGAEVPLHGVRAEG